MVRYQKIEDPRLYENYDNEVTGRLEKSLLETSNNPNYSVNSISILNKRYFQKDEKGNTQEDVKGLCARVAANVAYPDLYYGNEKQAYETAQSFYEAMINREFMPNSPTLMNAGREMQQLAACFVLPIDDSMESIFGQVYNTSWIHKSGGGTGFTFNKVRRKNDFVSSTYGKASGPVSFIIAYDAATHAVNQGGFRRGANMGILRIDHPDILEFIHAKENEKSRRFENFNFSIGITDKFMEAYKKGEHYVLKNPRKGESYDLTVDDLKRDEESMKQGLINQNERILVVEDGKVIYQNPIKRDLRGRITKVERKEVGKVDEGGRITLDTKIVLDEIASLAWRNGEPGIIFLDKIDRYNPTPEIGKIESTNPCGEQPLLPYEACNLGSINLGLMVRDRKVDYEKLERIVKTGVHFLDNVIDMSDYSLPLPNERIEEVAELIQEISEEAGVHKSYEESLGIAKKNLRGPIERIVRANRKIGLGVMGWADMLSKLNISYASEDAIKLAKEVMKFIQEKGVEESEKLAKERGAFPNFDKSVYSGRRVRRNATITTNAPTGTISIIAGASSAIEPFIELSYTHKDADGQIRYFGNKGLERDLKEADIDSDKVYELITDIKDEKGKVIKKGKSLQELDFIPEEIRRVYVTSDDIPVEYHIKMQAAFQEFTDNAVSKTINLGNSATVEDVKKAYVDGFKFGLKGLTVYRKGSREEEVITKGSRKGQEKLEDKVDGHIKLEKRPEVLEGPTRKQKTGCGNLFVTLNYDEGRENLFETFVELGKSGGCASCQNEAIGRLTSFLLRCNADPRAIAGQLIGIKCHRPYGGTGPNAIYSCPDAIGKAIAKELGMEIKDEIGDSEDFENLLENGGGYNEHVKMTKELTNDDTTIIGGACPECGCSMNITEGCLGGVCSNPACAYSECG